MATGTGQNLKMFDTLTQPVFAVRDEMVVYCNYAALERQIAIDDPAEKYLNFSEYEEELSENKDFEVEISINEEKCQAQVHRLDGNLLVVLNPEACAMITPDTLFTMSQSLRTPLNNMFSVAREFFPQLEALEDPYVSKNVASINRGLFQLLHLACNMTEFSSALFGELPMALEKTDIGAFLQELYERLEPLCELSGVELECSLPGRKAFAWIDRQKLERVLLNLVSNSLKYTPRGGKLVLRMESTPASVMIRLTDNGEGLEPELLSTVFSRFERPRQPGDPRWGVGFGLRLAQQIARLHGGALLVESKPGEGTAVTMSISRKEPTPEQKLKSPLAQVDYAGGYRHELVELADVLPLEVFDSVNVN